MNAERPSKGREPSEWARIGMLIAIVATIFPVVLGAVAGNERQRHAAYQAMRAEHQRALERDRERLAERRTFWLRRREWREHGEWPLGR